MFTSMLTRLRSLIQRRRVARELDDELMFHVEMETNAHIARGVAPVEARRRALRDLGGIDQTKEAVRDVRASWIDSLAQDVRYAVRSLMRRPSEGAAVICMLALGIGITTAMFTMVDALILRPVPFHEPDQLAFVYMGSETGGRTTVAPAVLRAWRDSGVFAAVAGANESTALIEMSGTFSTRGLARVTPNLFEMLGGVRPLRGRLFDASEGRPGATDRVLLSEDVWRSLFDADPAIIGGRITISGESVVVVGILPGDFRFPFWNTEIWQADTFELGPAATASAFPRAYVRFAAHPPQQDALRVAMEAARAADGTTAKLWPRVQPVVGQMLDAYYQRAAPMLAGGVVLVFFVLCANASSLLLARLTTRQREFCMRSALGAARARLMRQALVESSVLGALAVVAGIGVAWALVSLSRGFLPEALLVRTLNPLNIDVRAVAVTSTAGILATLAAGLLPAWIGTRVDASETSLRVSERSGTETRAARALTRTLLVGEIALACTLLVGATLLVRSFVNLVNTDRGLDTSGVMMAWVSFPPSAKDPSERETIARALEQKLREFPVVQQSAWSYGIPPNGGMISEGQWTGSGAGGLSTAMEVEGYYVGPDFFALYGIPLLRGRTFESIEPKSNVIVGERLAEALWPGQDPIGRSFDFEGKRRYHVVGLVREIHYPSLDARFDRPEFYEPFAQVSSMMLSIRCRGACPDTAAIRHRLLAAHPGVRLNRVAPLEAAYFEQLARPRAAAALGFAFAAIAVIAAAAGLFSVLTYAVGRRRKEFGVRTALGASPSQIRQLVLRDGFAVTLTGVALGTLAAWSLARTLASLQYGVTVGDPVSWVIVISLLGVTAMLASWRPAVQAMRADPVVLLREE